MNESVDKNSLLMSESDKSEENALRLQQVEQAWNQQDPRKIAEDLNALMQAMVKASYH